VRDIFSELLGSLTSAQRDQAADYLLRLAPVLLIVLAHEQTPEQRHQFELAMIGEALNPPSAPAQWSPALDAWLTQHRCKLGPNEEGDGLCLLPDEERAGQPRGNVATSPGDDSEVFRYTILYGLAGCRFGWDERGEYTTNLDFHHCIQVVESPPSGHKPGLVVIGRQDMELLISKYLRSLQGAAEGERSRAEQEEGGPRP
jgi:hypothetical protein